MSNDMKRLMIGLSLWALPLLSSVSAQTARKFTVNLSSDGKANMVAYLADKPTGRAIVDLPGGGYSHLSMQNEGHDWAAFYNKMGISYFVVTYRMPNGDRSIPIGDVCQAMRTVRDSAKVWGINPHDVGIQGFSAGGHLASTISTHTEYAERPDFSILFYPVISMNERDTHSGSVNGFLGAEGKKDKQLVKAFSNQNAVVRHLTPPAIILLANDDRAVPPVTNGIAYYSAMRNAGNSCALHVYPSGGHGFGFRENFKYHKQMLDDLTNWLLSQPSPKQEALRVACIGNSITDGHGIDMATANGYPAQLQRLLGSGYWVKNFGVSSRTMLEKGDHPYMKEQAWRDALAFCPDVVVIKLGTNDSKPENWQHGSEFEHDLMLMIDRLSPKTPVLNKKGRPTKKTARTAKPRILLCTPIPAQKKTWNISDSVITHEIIPILQTVAAREGLQVIDLHTQFCTGQRDTDAKLMQRDGIHPTEQGARRIAEIVAEAVSSIKEL